MDFLKGIPVSCILLLFVGCAGDGDKDKGSGKGKGSEEQQATCSKSGTIANFTITCTKPIESFHTGNITMTPQKIKMTLNNVEVSFSDSNKVITGKDAGSGKTSMTWDLTLEGSKQVSVTIP